jgi:hypothetical protein
MFHSGVRFDYRASRRLRTSLIGIQSRSSVNDFPVGIGESRAR